MAGLVEQLTPEQFVSLRAAGETWLLLDVREAWELETVCVPDCIHIPMGEIHERRSELEERTPVAVLCHSGGRSARVADYLAASGFERVANVAGGIDAWAVQVDSMLPRY